MRKALSLITFLCFSFQMSFAATITFPEVYDVLKVNGQDYSSGFFSKKSDIELTPGRHVVLYRYNELFEDPSNDDHAKIKSEPFVMIVDMSDANLTVQSPEILDEMQARKYALKPTLTIMSSNNTPASFSLSSLRDFEKAQYQRAIEVARETPLTTAPANDNQIPNDSNTGSALPKDSESGNVSSQSRAYQMLNYWWQQASKEERKAFLHSIQQGH
ncbi:DUF2057 family protein [Thalassotalea euphylliae]|uniref:YccT family protein n=1 Tax=Thalassotalea euphylliae TaxID=1655234 RepID=UPI003634F3B7